MNKYIVGMTGASGSIYGLRIIEALLKMNFQVHVILTKTAERVMVYELEKSIKELFDGLNCLPGILHIEDIENFFADISSGSYLTEGMLIAPCSMGTLGKISSGTGDNLLIRAADVCLKERRKLVIIPRETPLNTIHLENMLRISNAGGIIVPPVPAFYSKPKTINDIINQTVGRSLHLAGVENKLYTQWSHDQNI